MTHRADVAVIGGGIVGLAFAWTAARAGRSVVLFERDLKAQGASIRNFGMVWPIGQSSGPDHARALRSRELWRELALKAGISLDPVGSLHLAYQADELAVIEDPRQAIAKIPGYLAETDGVQLRFGQVVTSVEMPLVRTADGEVWDVDHAFICGGTDFRTLFPEIFDRSGIRLCKLQMMRTAPQPEAWRLGPMVAGGLTLCHYSAFQACPSLGELKRRFAETMPEFVRQGIHVMASQNAIGEVVIGDSHEYDEAIEPFDKPAIDAMILGYLKQLIDLPEWTMNARWHGIYAKHPTRLVFTAEPQPGARIVTAPGGAGMTLAFGFAEELWNDWQTGPSG
jgi:glycine/D-amino acid oxidase-like deaminating enzyme